MPLFLVHGGTFAGSCWDKVKPLLTSEALAVDLPGRSSRPLDHRHVSLHSNAQSIVDQMDEVGFSWVDLVGHSLGGATILAVAELFPERVRNLIFLGAPIPRNGESVFSAVGGAAQAFIGAASERGDASLPSPAVTGSFGEIGTAYGVSEAVGPFFEPVPVHSASCARGLHYIRMGEDQALVPELQDCAVSHLRGFGDVTVHDCAGDHMVMLSDAQLLARLLNEIVEHPQKIV